MAFVFTGELISWRGPAPFHFIRVPAAHCERIREAASLVSYGWGMIPVSAEVAGVSWRTSMWPRDGAYLLPVRADVRRQAGLELGAVAEVRLELGL